MGEVSRFDPMIKIKGICILMGPMHSRGMVQIVLNVLILMTIGGLPARAASPSVASHKNVNGDFLDAPVKEFSTTSPSELGDLCSTISIPCGWEKSYVRKGESRISPPWNTPLHLKNTTARKILDEIILRHPGHHWFFHDGVINIEPNRRGHKDLLLRKLDHLSIHGSSRMAVEYVILRARIGGHGPAMVGVFGRVHYNRVDLELNDVTVRQALNAIVKADGKAMWIFAPEEQVGNFQAYYWVKSWASSGATYGDSYKELDERVKVEKLHANVQP